MKKQQVLRKENKANLTTMIEKFLEYLGMKNYSAETVKSRKKQLRLLLEWCEERAIEEVRQISSEHISRYQVWLYERKGEKGSPLTAQSRSNILIGTRLFFQWLSKNKYIENNPAIDIELPKLLPRMLPNVFTEKEVEILLATIDITTEVGIRNRTMLELCYSTGIRRKEILGLKVEDIDLNKEMVKIEQAKGGHCRIIPFGERAKAWIEKYLEQARPKLLRGYDDRTMFLSAYGRGLSKTQFDEMIRERKIVAGIEKRGNSHLFRHTMATLMLEGGADIRYIQQMLGHKDLKNTQIYTQVTDFKLKQVHTLTHPGANLPTIKTNYSTDNSSEGENN
jgi:integrase/recombinase XerD